MRIQVCHVGKTKSPWVRDGESDFKVKMKRFGGIDETIIKASRLSDPQQAKSDESDRLLAHLDKAPRMYNVLLDERGTSYTSTKFATQLDSWLMHQGGAIRFITGGPFGVSKYVRDRCDQQLALSHMVMTHELVRLVLLEQIYRAFTILRGESYHHV